MQQSRKPPAVPSRPWLLPIVIVVCAMGAGICGTLLWVQSHTTTNYVSSTSQSTAERVQSTAEPSNVAGNTSGESHGAPPELTAGMAPPQAALALGNWEYDHERWPTAIEYYRRAIAGGIDNPNVRTDMGNALRFAGQPKVALAQYAIARRQDPNHEQSLFNQGGVYASELKQPEKAIAIWRAYIKKFPNGKSVSASHQLIAEAQKLKAGKKKP